MYDNKTRNLRVFAMVLNNPLIFAFNTSSFGIEWNFAVMAIAAVSIISPVLLLKAPKSETNL